MRTLDPGTIEHLLWAIPCPAFIVDHRGVIHKTNVDLDALLGYRPGELIGVLLDDLVPFQIRAHHPDLVHSYFQSPSRRIMAPDKPVTVLHKDGSELTIQVQLIPFEQDGSVRALGTISIAAKEQSIEALQPIFGNSPYGILLVDDQGTIQLANPELCRMFGYPAEHLVGQSLEMLLPDRYRAAHLGLRAAFNIHPETRTMGKGRDLTGLHADGREFPIEIGLSPIQLHGRLQTMASVIDITMRKKMELDLRQLNMHLEEFTYVASHDLRSPIRGIANLVDWLLEDLVPGARPEVENNLNRIKIRIARMEELIDNLLAYARAGNVKDAVQTVVLQQVLDKTVGLLNIPEGFRVETDIQIESIAASPTPLEVALRNLISNAVKHHDGKQGLVRVSCRPEGNMCHIAVSDDGPGIPDFAKDRIFRLFQTADSGAARGSGIGLAVARRVTEAAGGHIELSSNTPDRGVTFHLFWPRFHRRAGIDEQ